MRLVSVADRLDRLADPGHVADLERTVVELATEYGLHWAEVPVELEQAKDSTTALDSSTPERVVQRYVEAFGLPGADLGTEYARIAGPAGAG